MIKVLKAVLNFLAKLSCKSKCCCGSECECGSKKCDNVEEAGSNAFVDFD